MQNTYKAGDKVFIHVDALAKVGVDVDLYVGYVDEEYFSGTVLSLHAGRTWNVQMEFGETVRVASRNFFKEPGEKQKKVVQARTTTRNREADDDDLEEDDCEYESAGEDGLERLAESEPTKRNDDCEWTECTVPVDARDARGQVSNLAHH